MNSPALTDVDQRRRLLGLFPTSARSLVANIFLDKVRGGITEPCAIVDAVQRDATRRLAWAVSDDRYNPTAALLCSAIDNDPDEAIDFARWCIEWERLPNDQRQQLKEERGADHRRRWMEQQPATERQVAYVRALGWTGTEPASKAEASRLIDELRTRGVA